MITKAPESVRSLKGKDRTAALSLLARESARISGRRSGLDIHRFEKDRNGLPLPCNRIHWSISHKPDVVAGVVSTGRIGIDIEKIKDIPDRLFNKIVGDDERQCFGNQEDRMIFFRVFTAKEAVLKKTGDGIRGLSEIQVSRVVDDTNLVLAYRQQKYWVENFSFDGYLASVTKDQFELVWTLEQDIYTEGKKDG